MAWSDYVVGNNVTTINVNPVKPGNIYRHFKGGVYRVVRIVKDEVDRDRTLVIYENIKDGSGWAREISIFESLVDAEKYPEFAGHKRMEYIGYIPL